VSGTDPSGAAGVRRAVGAVTVAAACLAPIGSQPLLMERRAYSHAVELRHRLLAECLQASPERRQRAARELTEAGTADPYRALARALAAVRGVACDDAFAFRAGLIVFAMPEIVDRETFQEIAVTVHAPYPPVLAGEAKFAVQVRDADGKVVAQARIDRETAADDLIRFRAVARIPVAGLADGTYTVAVQAELDGAPPRAHDPELATACHVLAKFKQRHDELLARRAEVADALAPADQALLDGLLAGVRRVHEGEPPYRRSRALDELAAAGRALANAAAKKPLLEGLRGFVTVGVPVGEQMALVALRLPRPAAARAPLCLVVPGTPAHDAHSARPTSPPAVPPEAMARELEIAGFDAAGRFALAVLESPGRLPSAADAIADVARALQRGFALGHVAVLGEREGAVAAALCCCKHPGLVRALGLVAGAAVGPALFEPTDAPRVLAVPATGHASTENLRRLHQAAPPGQATWLDDAGARPWPIAFGLEARALADFVLYATKD
jgi:hypothetical protein